MSRQRGDIHERALGPLFGPPETRLYGANDPKTSRAAARHVLDSGEARSDELLLLRMIQGEPGHTMEEYGALAARAIGGDPYRWRLKLGRRTGGLLERRLVHQKNERGGMGLWYPGPDPDRP